jgi:hypothetical protein
MQIDTSTMVPWTSSDYNENLLVDFLNQGCYWKGAHTYGDKEAFFVAYAEFCRQRGNTSEPRGMTETRLRRLNHEVNSIGIRGVFVRTGNETPAASDTPKLPGGTATLSTPRELPILPTDDPIVAEQKRKYNAALRPEQPKEVVFTSAKGAM